ncbi:hypothetical protein D9M71_620740 [compost metagenome]
MGIERRAIRFRHSRVGSERRSLAGQRQLHRLFRAQVPGVVQVQIRNIASHQRRVSQPGAIVFRGMFGDGQCGGDGFPYRRIAGSRGAG